MSWEKLTKTALFRAHKPFEKCNKFILNEALFTLWKNMQALTMIFEYKLHVNIAKYKKISFGVQKNGLKL